MHGVKLGAKDNNMNRPYGWTLTNVGDTFVQEVRAGDEIVGVQIDVPNSTTVVLEGSNDNITFYPMTVAPMGLQSTPQATMTVAGIYITTVQSRFMRLRKTIGVGPVSGNSVFGQGWIR